MNLITLSKVIAAGVLLCGSAFAQQATRTVTLTWQDAVNPPGTTYRAYRAAGSCSPTSTYVQIASDIAAKTYDDAGVPPGRRCYTVTAVYDTLESDKSDPAEAQVKPFRPGGLSLVVTVASAVARPAKWLVAAMTGSPASKQDVLHLRVYVR